MFIRRRTFLATASASAAAGFLPACSRRANTGMTLNRGNGGEPKSLDPHHIDTTFEVNVVGDLLMGVATEDAAGNPVPGAAARWETSPDGRTWTFHLRPHVWSDGVPVTAQDFVFAWRRLLDPKNGAPYAYNLWVVKNAASISRGALPPAALGASAPDEKTFVVTLEHPAPYLPQLLMHETAYPLPRHAIEKFGDDWTRADRHVSNGAYRLGEWLPGDHITLVKNPRFFDAAKVRIETVNYFPTFDTAAALKRLRAGELDTQNPLPALEIGWLRAHMPAALRMTPYLGVWYALMNYARKPFQDLRVREAVTLAFNREMIADRIYRLGEPAAYGMVPPAVANYPGGAALRFKAMPYDARVARARGLMESAGYSNANRLQTTFAATTDPDNKRAAAAIQAMLRAIHVDLEIVQAEVQIHFQNLQQHNFDIAGATWIADFDDASNFLDLLRSDVPNNYSLYRNKAYDALLDEAQQEADAQARGRLLVRAEQMALDDFAWIPVRFLMTRDLVQPYVKNWVSNARNMNRTRWLEVGNKTLTA